MILGLDPGSTRSALVAYDPKREAIGFRALEANALVAQRLPHLRTLYGDETLLVVEHSPAYTVVGGSKGRFFPQQVIDTAKWIGRFEQAWAGEGGDFRELARKEVVMHLCGNPRAGDPHVRAALIARLGEPGTKKAPGGTYGIKADLWAALAVAVTWGDLHDRA